jgi:GR25 family glycosyltransferase involved in LPS biosynthesis
MRSPPRSGVVSPKPKALVTGRSVAAATEAARAEMECRAKETVEVAEAVDIEEKQAKCKVEDEEVAEVERTEAEETEVVQAEHDKEDSKAEEAAFLAKFNSVVINMERRPDRLEGCSSRLAANCPGLKFERMAAIDGRKTVISPNFVTTSWDTSPNVVYQRKRSERKGWDDLHTYHERVLELSPGERGCAASHIKAWRHCLASGTREPLLVIEDDAAPMPDFASILKRALASLPSDAHILYLGYSQAAHWRREVSAELVEAEYVWTTVGYIVWPAAAELLLSMLPINQPVDNWMAQLCASGNLKSFCIRPKLIRQSDAWNCGSDIRHSDEGYWGPDSDIIHSEAVPVPPTNPLARSIPGAILDDGSCFWDLSFTQKDQMS